MNAPLMPAQARLVQDCLHKVEVLEHPEPGMEAARTTEAEGFPAVTVMGGKGHDFHDGLG